MMQSMHQGSHYNAEQPPTAGSSSASSSSTGHHAQNRDKQPGKARDGKQQRRQANNEPMNRNVDNGNDKNEDDEDDEDEDDADGEQLEHMVDEDAISRARPTGPGHQQQQQQQAPSLKRLVEHFVQAKRALASTSYVYRANEIVAAARVSLETIASLLASNAFLHASLRQRLETLKAIRLGAQHIDLEGDKDFKNVLRGLDSVDARVKSVLQALKLTVVEPSFRPNEEERKCLHDFVDEQGVHDLTSIFHRCIDQTNVELGDFADSNRAFDDELEAVDNTLAESAQHSQQAQTFAPTRATFHSLESLATEIADLLQSLVRHYDLCVTAVKHTEGGGEAVQDAHLDLPESVSGGPGAGNGAEAAGKESTSPVPPISDEEKLEMIQVLDKDAAEVEEVVAEIAEYASQMEEQLGQITARVDALTTEQSSLLSGAKLLARLGENVPRYIAAGSTFRLRWGEQRTQILDKMDELEGVRDFYEGFLEAYDGLILEIGRRRAVQTKKDKIVADALAKLERLYHADLADREAFKVEQGEYLPSDIWPGLVDPPTRYELTSLGPAPTELPLIPKDVLQQALQRRKKG